MPKAGRSISTLRVRITDCYEPPVWARETVLGLFVKAVYVFNCSAFPKPHIYFFNFLVSLGARIVSVLKFKVC